MRGAGGLGWRKLLAQRTFMAAAAALAGVLAAAGALAQSADCARLQAAIASAPHGGGQLQAAADRQRAELSRTSAYAHSIGCDNQKFLFFGSEPPAQCGEIKGQLARMQANLADLQARSGGGRPGRSRRALQRRMRQRAEAADQLSRSPVRRRSASAQSIRVDDPGLDPHVA